MSDYDDAIERAGRLIAAGRAEQAQRTPREAAEAAYQPGGKSIDELEDIIRTQRGLPAKHRRDERGAA